MRQGLLASLTLKWRVLLAYWAAHALAALALGGIWTAMSGSVDGPARNHLGLDGISGTPDVWTQPDWLIHMAAYIAVWVILQVLLVLPMRAPDKPARGVPVLLSIASAGMLFAILVGGLGASVLWVFAEYDLIDTVPVDSWWGLAAVVVLHWVFLTPVVAAFTRARDRESLVTRLSTAVFAGSVVDFALMIPLDVLLRRKSCYCWSATFVMLPVSAAIALLALGPMFWLPLAARRRRTRGITHCLACGYDLAALPRAAPCPECGTPRDPFAPAPRPPSASPPTPQRPA